MSVWSRRFSTLIAGAALLSSAALAAPAWAQGKPEDRPTDVKAAAKEHYTRGTSFYDLGRYDDAIKEFEAAYELKNDPAFLYNLAQSYRQAGKHDQAVHFYKTYLRYVPKAPNRADIEEKIKAEEKAEEQLAVQQPGTTPPTNTTTPPANTTTPPTNTTPPGNEPNVNVPPPNTTTEPPPGYTPPPGSAPAPGATTSDPGRKFRIAGAATAAVGGIMYVIGIIEWRRALSASKDVENAAANNQAFDPEAQRRGQSAETAQRWLYTLGTVAVGAGVGLWFYGNHVTTAAETTTWRVSLAPVVTPGEGGATLRITF